MIIQNEMKSLGLCIGICTIFSTIVPTLNRKCASNCRYTSQAIWYVHVNYDVNHMHRALMHAG